METTTAGTTWADVLLRGVNGLIDSQSQKAYAAQQAQYNTQQGLAGQAQMQASAATTRTAVIAGAVVLAVVLFIALRR